MPTQQVNRIDLCKGFKVAKKLDLAAPLAAVDPVGIASLGCQPLVSSRQAANNAILSRVNQESGGYLNPVLTSLDDADLHAGYPNYSAYIAGLPGANPLTGTATSPFPSSAISYQFDYQIGGFVFRRESNPHTIPPAFGQSPVGFGRFIQANPYLLLAGGDRFDASPLGVRAPFHHYEQVMRLPYCPTGSMTAIYNSGTGSLTSQDSLAGTSFSQSTTVSGTTYSVNITLWEVFPTLTTVTGDTVAPALLDPHSLFPNEAQSPDFIRTYNYLDFGPITMPGYGGSAAADYDITTVRPWLVGYATGAVNSATLNGVGGAGFGGSIGPITLTYFTTPPNPFSFPQSFSWGLPLTTTSFAWTVDVGGQTLTPSVQVIGDPTIPRYYEAYITGQVV